MITSRSNVNSDVCRCLTGRVSYAAEWVIGHVLSGMLKTANARRALPYTQAEKGNEPVWHAISIRWYAEDSAYIAIRCPYFDGNTLILKDDARRPYAKVRITRVIRPITISPVMEITINSNTESVEDGRHLVELSEYSFIDADMDATDRVACKWQWVHSGAFSRVPSKRI